MACIFLAVGNFPLRCSQLRAAASCNVGPDVTGGSSLASRGRSPRGRASSRRGIAAVGHPSADRPSPPLWRLGGVRPVRYASLAANNV